MSVGAPRNTSRSARVLSNSLGMRFFGFDVRAELFVRNGFRVAAVPADADTSTVRTATQEVRNLSRLSVDAAMQKSIRIGYDTDWDAHTISECLNQLNDSRYRFFLSLFWFHLNGQVSASVAADRDLTSPKVLSLINAAANDGDAHCLGSHALAIALQNQAIASELAMIGGKSSGAGGAGGELWPKVLSLWARVHGSDAFWEYLKGCAVKMKDPRVGPAQVQELRDALPRIILSFHVLFAREHAKLGNDKRCRQHLEWVLACKMPEADRDAASAEIGQSVFSVLIADALAQANTLVQTKGLSGVKFAAKANAILDDAIKTIDSLKVSANSLHRVDCDALCEALVKGINGSVDYKQDRCRSIIRGMLLVKRMMSLPLTDEKRRALKNQLRSDVTALYGDEMLAGSKSLDPTLCWFLPGEPVDPDACIIVEVYRVTSRELKVNRFQGTAGVSVGYRTRQILIPRSARAQSFHDGRVKLSGLVPALSQAPAGVWTPPAASYTAPFELADGTKAHYLVDVFLAWRNVIASSGLNSRALDLWIQHLSTWLENRGQNKLAAQLRAFDGGGDVDGVGEFLLAAALAEIAGMAASIDEQVEGCARLQEQLCKDEIAKLRRAARARIDAVVAAHPQVREAWKKIKHIEDQLAVATADEERKLQQQYEGLDADMAGPIGDATGRVNAARKKCASKGPYLWGLLVAGGAVGGMIAARPFWPAAIDWIHTRLGLGPGDEMGRGITLHDAAMLARVAVGVVALVAFIFCAGTMKLSRRLQAWWEGRPLRRLKRILADSRAALKEQSDAIVAEKAAESQAQIARVRSELGGAAETIDKIQADFKRESDAVKAKHREAVEARRRELKPLPDALKKRLDEAFHPRGQSAKDEFAPLVAALGKGFKRGSEPPQSELQMTYSERQSAMAQLGIY